MRRIGQNREICHQLLPNTLLPGFVNQSELPRYYAIADVFVLPTRQDTYAAVVHEAACLGLPLIVSRHAGAAGVLVREGGSGFIIDPADTSAFADRMQVLLDAGLRQRMAAEARARGDELSAHRRGPAVWRWMKQEFLSGHETEASAGMP